MSFSETIFLFFLALVIFGPKKLPEIARQVGKVLNEFRRASNEFKAQIEQEISHLEMEEKKRTILPPSPLPENTASRTLNATPEETSAVPAAPAEARASSEPAVSPSEPDDEPLFATQTAVPANGAGHVTDAEAKPLANDAVISSTSQESHA